MLNTRMCATSIVIGALLGGGSPVVTPAAEDPGGTGSILDGILAQPPPFDGN